MASLFIYKYILHHAFTMKPPKKLTNGAASEGWPINKEATTYPDQQFFVISSSI